MSRVVTSSGTIDYGLVWGGCGAKVKNPLNHNFPLFNHFLKRNGQDINLLILIEILLRLRGDIFY